MAAKKQKIPLTAPSSGDLPVLSSRQIGAFRGKLLGWYDRHRRVLPWRAMSGRAALPYHVWLSEIMLQQTVVAAVIPYFQKFVEKWPTVHDLASAPQEDVMQAWAGLGYYARARNLHKCAKIVSAELKGRFPGNPETLRALPGIGDYTSAAITAIAFGKPANVVDGNVERVMARYFAIAAPLPESKKMLKAHAALLADGREDRPGDYAQALMDLGATVCTPKSPSCHSCPLNDNCAARARGIAETLPAKTAKGIKPQREGYVYWITNDKGYILLERRPEKGLLGGMAGLPTSAWAETGTALRHPDYLAGQDIVVPRQKLEIFHSFTHFDLRLTGKLVETKNHNFVKNGFFWADPKKPEKLGLPTVFKKFVKLMAGNANR